MRTGAVLCCRLREVQLWPDLVFAGEYEVRERLITEQEVAAAMG